MLSPTERRNSDPVTTEVIRGWMESVTDEMQETIIKTAHSPLICEARDATCALFDHEGRTAAQASAMPIHLGVLAELGKRFAEKYPAGVAQRGDLYITNDPYAGGTHMPDIAISAPVFAGQDLVGYVSTMAHHKDIGGLLPASVSVKARDIHAEGLRLPMVRISKGGVVNEDLMSLIVACSRTPESFYGDLGAQIAACNTGVRRFSEIFDRWPVQTVQDCMTTLMDYSERMTRLEIEKIPDGEYFFEDWLDDNAVDVGSEPIHVAVTMRVNGSEIEFDFSGTGNQVDSAINNVLSSTASVVYYIVRTLTGDDVANNDGCYRPISVKAPLGSIVNCTYPAPVASRALSLFRIEDVVNGAMGLAMPERMTAAHSGQYNMVSVAGTDPSSGKAMIGQLGGPVVGGHGARSNSDGIDVSSHGVVNGTIDALELGEARYPMVFREMRLWEDSGGVGRYRGGLGYYAEVEWLRGDAMITFRRERMKHRPWGIAGGGCAPLGRTQIVRSEGTAEDLPGKVQLPINPGERLRYWVTGSGGHGNPTERDPEKVLDDVLNGRVSAQSAHSEYGVIIDGGRVDEEGTKKLREGMLV